MADSPSKMIDARIAELGDWRGETLAHIRKLIKQTPMSSKRMICTRETYKNVVKVTFAKCAALPDPSGMFNSSLDGNTLRAIDFHEDDTFDDEALKALIRIATAHNVSTKGRK